MVIAVTPKIIPFTDQTDLSQLADQIPACPVLHLGWERHFNKNVSTSGALAIWNDFYLEIQPLWQRLIAQYPTVCIYFINHPSEIRIKYQAQDRELRNPGNGKYENK